MSQIEKGNAKRLAKAQQLAAEGAVYSAYAAAVRQVHRALQKSSAFRTGGSEGGSSLQRVSGGGLCDRCTIDQGSLKHIFFKKREYNQEEGTRGWAACLE